jgi:hypothetical protein
MANEKEAGGAPAGQGVDVFGRRWALRGGLLQEDVERYTRAFNEVVPRPVGAAEQRAAELKAAIVAGWIVSPACAAREEIDLASGQTRRVYLFDGVEIGKMRAREVYHYARLVSRRYVEETEPPDPNG